MNYTAIAPAGRNDYLDRALHALGLDADSRRFRRIYRDTYAELNRLSDRELSDIGLCRLTLDEVALDHARRTA